MNHLSRAQGELLEMDMLAAQDSVIHRIHPLCKLNVTLVYILEVVSFSKYDLSGLAVMVLYPVVCFQLAGIPVSLCFYKLRVVLPLVCAVGLVNPFFDRTPMLQLGSILISGGVISMITLMLKGIFSLMASFLLVSTTSMDALCAALRKLHVPSILVTLLLLTYRYISVMIQEVAIMTDAYHLRAPGQKGIHISAWGSFLGQLLLRSMDRAEELFQSMQLRGFHGDFYYADSPPCTVGAVLYGIGWMAVFLLARYFDLPQLLGNLFL